MNHIVAILALVTTFTFFAVLVLLFDKAGINISAYPDDSREPPIKPGSPTKEQLADWEEIRKKDEEV